MDRPQDPNVPHTTVPAFPERPSDVAIHDTTEQGQGYDGQSQSLGNLTQSQGRMERDESVAALDASIGIQGDEGGTDGYRDNAADAFVGSEGGMAEDDAPPGDTPETEGTTSAPAEPNAVDAVTFEGKKVFSPHELNQSGEDKEYFPPNKDHQFDVPRDANDHALTPDVEVTPNQDVKIIR